MSKPKTFRITRASDKAMALVTAETFTHDGMGHRFFDANEKLVANFAYGELSEVVDSTISFNKP